MKIIRIILLLICLLITGYFLITGCTETRKEDEEQKESGQEEEQKGPSKFVTLSKEMYDTLGIKVKKLETSEVPTYLEAVGEVIANSNLLVNITPITGGKVKIIKVNLGAHVHKGDILAVIFSPDLSRAIADFHAGAQKLKISSENLRIKQEFAGTGAFSGPPYESKKEELAGAKAAFISAGENLDIAEVNLKAASAELKKAITIQKTGDFGKRPMDEAKSQFAKAESEYLQSQNQLIKAEEELHRSEKLYKAGIASKKELLAVQTEYEDAKTYTSEKKSQLEIARGILDREEIIYEKGVRSESEIENVKAKYTQAEKEYSTALAELQKAKTDLSIIESQMKREENIYSKDLNTIQELQQAESSYKEAQIEYERAVAVLKTFSISPENASEYAGGELHVFSPIDGYVMERNVNTGEVIYTNTVIFKVLDDSTIWVDSEIYEKDFSKVKIGQIVEITTSAYPDKLFKGKIFYISSSFHQETRTFDIRMSLDNKENLFKPGMTVNSRITTGTNKGLILPAGAVLDDLGTKIVFTAVKGKEYEFERREVQAELLKNKEYLITEGLSTGDDVVIEGAFDLRSAANKNLTGGEED